MHYLNVPTSAFVQASVSSKLMCEMNRIRKNRDRVMRGSSCQCVSAVARRDMRTFQHNTDMQEKATGSLK